MANKVFTILGTCFKVLAVILGIGACFFSFVDTITIDGTTGIPTEQVFITGLLPLTSTMAIIALFVGGLLIFSKNYTVELAGYGLFLGPIVAMLATAFQSTSGTPTTYILGLGSIFEIIAAACILLSLGCRLLVLLLLSPTYKNAQLESRIATLKEYKKLQEEGIITAEEYEEKRSAVLGLQKAQTTKK